MASSEAALVPRAQTGTCSSTRAPEKFLRKCLTSKDFPSGEMKEEIRTAVSQNTVERDNGVLAASL